MCGAWWLNSTPPCGEGTDETAPDRSTPAPDGEAVESSTTTVECDTGEAAEDLMHPLLLRCVAGGLAAGPGAVPVADEWQRGHVQENLTVTMIIIEEEENDESNVAVEEAEEPSFKAGQEPAHAGVTMVRRRHAAVAASTAAAPPSPRHCAQGYAATLEIAA